MSSSTFNANKYIVRTVHNHFNTKWKSHCDSTKDLMASCTNSLYQPLSFVRIRLPRLCRFCVRHEPNDTFKERSASSWSVLNLKLLTSYLGKNDTNSTNDVDFSVDAALFISPKQNSFFLFVLLTICCCHSEWHRCVCVYRNGSPPNVAHFSWRLQIKLIFELKKKQSTYISGMFSLIKKR